MLRTLEFKLYLTDAQARTLSDWLGRCCWLYNRALEMRSKAWKRRKESISYNAQTAWLTQLRKRKDALAAVPFAFARDGALKRVDRAMQAFFRRCKAGEKPGFPRFKSRDRFNSMELVQSGRYVRSQNLLSIPKLGLVRFRGGDRAIPATQKLLRIIRRASGWYAQVLIDDGKDAPPKRDVQSAVGIDLGLSSLAAMSNGETIENPRYAKRALRKLRAMQRRVSRRKNRSHRRREAVRRLRRQHERIAAQRRSFAHQETRKLVDRSDLIAIENLNVKGLGRTRLARSVHDAGWSTFTSILKSKAEEAGVLVIEVNPSGTSQTCPDCGRVAKKKLAISGIMHTE